MTIIAIKFFLYGGLLIFVSYLNMKFHKKDKEALKEKIKEYENKYLNKCSEYNAIFEVYTFLKEYETRLKRNKVGERPSSLYDRLKKL